MGKSLKVPFSFFFSDFLFFILRKKKKKSFVFEILGKEKGGKCDTI